MTQAARLPIHVALAGLVSLAVAMGIGRFAPTPLFPIMLSEGLVDLHAASWLASANYIGYLLGSLACTFQPWLFARLGWRAGVNGPALVRVGLASTVVLTLAMWLPVPALWPVLRFLAGIASSLAFIYTSGWCVAQLARMGKPATGSLIYVGPGAGIVFSGLTGSALVAGHWPSTSGWLVFGLFSAVLTAIVWRVFDPRSAAPPTASAAAAPAPARDHGIRELAMLACVYGVAGFGYIVTATFLPVIARQAFPGSPWPDLFWPVFGAGVIVGAWAVSRIRTPRDHRLSLTLCYVIQCAGVALPLLSPTLAGFVIGSALLGLPFTAITFFGVQEVQRLRPGQTTPFIGLLTIAFGLGQIAGPPLAVALVARSATQAAGFNLSLEIAAGALAVGAMCFALMIRMYPPLAAGRTASAG